MITDLANLGPSLRTTSDLGVSSKKGLDKNSQSEKSGSFDQILQQNNVEKPSDSKVRTTYAKPDPSPVQKDLDKVDAEKVDTDQAKAKPTNSEPRTAQKDKNGDEPGSVKDKVRSEKVGKKSNTQSQDRQSVMLQFMDSMESEFGIPPTKMVEAMTNLSDSELKASPEDSASQVIAQLDLPKEEEPKAYAMYMSLLAQLNQLQQPQQQPSASSTTVTAVAAIDLIARAMTCTSHKPWARLL